MADFESASANFSQIRKQNMCSSEIPLVHSIINRFRPGISWTSQTTCIWSLPFHLDRWRWAGQNNVDRFRASFRGLRKWTSNNAFETRHKILSVCPSGAVLSACSDLAPVFPTCSIKRLKICFAGVHGKQFQNISQETLRHTVRLNILWTWQSQQHVTTFLIRHTKYFEILIKAV